MKCINCGSRLATTRGRHHYLGSGLSNVVLVGVDTSTCSKCGTVEVAIPSIAKLHAMLAVKIADTTERLTPEQIKFLRKYLGWSSVRFAKKIGCDRTTVHRWETGDVKMPKSAERLLRVLVRYESPLKDYGNPVDLENIGIDDPVARTYETCLKNGSWMPPSAKATPLNC
jgi:putative zinc finger/helix-turn-helix YgiT family protein